MKGKKLSIYTAIVLAFAYVTPVGASETGNKVEAEIESNYESIENQKEVTEPEEVPSDVTTPEQEADENTEMKDMNLKENCTPIPGLNTPDISNSEISLLAIAGEWITQDGRWWYRHYDGTYTTNGWEEIGEKWYYFDSAGWMCTDYWVNEGGKWYYCDDSGVLVVLSWRLLGGKWYYFDSHGVMATGWQKLGGEWYYFNSVGVMTTGRFDENGSIYLFESNGKLYYTILGVSRQDQQGDNLCWASTARTIGIYDTSIFMTQTAIVTHIKGSFVDSPATNDESLRAIRFASQNFKNPILFRSSMPYTTVIQNIDNRHPMKAGLQLTINQHTVTLAGYNKLMQTIYIVNPGRNVVSKFIPYNNLINGGDTGAGEGTWIDTILY